MYTKPIILLATIAIAMSSGAAFGAKAPATSSWAAGVVLTSSGKPDPTRGDPQQNSVAVNASGLAVAVWDHYEYTFPNGAEWVEAAVQRPGGKWSAPVRLSSTLLYAYHPRVAVGGDGTAIAVWIADSGAGTQPQNREIQYMELPADGGAWRGPYTLDTGLVGPVLTTLDIPQVAMDSSGHAIVTWVIWDGTNMMVKAARREPAAVASQWLTYKLSPSARDGLLPSVAMNQSGDAIVAWGLAGWPRTYTTCTLQVAKWAVGLGAPSPAVTLPQQQQGCVNYYSAPQVAIDGLGLGTVSWVFTNMYSLSETAPDVWQSKPVEVVRPGPGQYLSNPSLAGDAAGNLTIGYSIWDPNVGVDRGSAFAVSRPAKGDWSAPFRFTYTTSQDAQFVRAASSADGSLTFVGWVDNYNSVLQVSQRSSAGGWLKPQTIGKSSNMGFAQYFSIGTATGGNARVVWKTQSGQSQVASQFRP